MKNSQKLIVTFENYSVTVKFEDLSKDLLPLANKLEVNGDKLGPSVYFDGAICITMRYADKCREANPAAKIFGYDEAEFLAKQYK